MQSAASPLDVTESGSEELELTVLTANQELMRARLDSVGGAGLPDGVGKVHTLPGFDRKSIQLQDQVSLTETGLVGRASYTQIQPMGSH